jgi:DNA-binding MarR family transcriptional regulator
MPGIDSELQSRFSSEQQKAMLNVLFTANWLRAMQVAVFKPFGLSPQQYNILRILRGATASSYSVDSDGGRMKMQAVKERMIDRAPNATRLTDKLIAKGLVIRERCDMDRRVVYVRISPKGLELLKRLDEVNRTKLDPVLEGLGTEDAHRINRILDGWRG